MAAILSSGVCELTSAPGLCDICQYSGDYVRMGPIYSHNQNLQRLRPANISFTFLNKLSTRLKM